MNKKVISTTLVAVVVLLVFFLLPFGDAQALNGNTNPSISNLPTPNPSVGPDYTDFGGSLTGNLLTTTGTGSAICAAQEAANLFLGAGFDINYCIDNFIIRPIMRTIENSIENTLLNQINGVVTDKLGGGKDPHFVTDWRNAILNSQGQGNDIFRSILADTDLCPYFSDSIKPMFGADLSQYAGVIKNFTGSSMTNIPGTESFQYLNKCSLSSDINVDAFRNDFTQGGWRAFTELQLPENNFTNVLSHALTEQQNQMALAGEATKQENAANNGFLPSGVGADGKTKANACSLNGLTRCIFKAGNVTPGQLFGTALTKTFDQKFETIGGAQEIQDLILALADSVINKLTGRLTNLLGSGGNTLAPPNLNGASRAICIANCQLASYPQCSAPLPPDTTLTCTQRAVTACQQTCP